MGIKNLGNAVIKHIDDFATQGGVRIGNQLYKHGIASSEIVAAKIGKIGMYGAMGGAAIGAVSNLGEYDYGIGNGMAHTVGGSLSGAGLGAVGAGGAAMVATAIAKGLR